LPGQEHLQERHLQQRAVQSDEGREQDRLPWQPGVVYGQAQAAHWQLLRGSVAQSKTQEGQPEHQEQQRRQMLQLQLDARDHTEAQQMQLHRQQQRQPRARAGPKSEPGPTRPHPAGQPDRSLAPPRSIAPSYVPPQPAEAKVSEPNLFADLACTKRCVASR
jgi:hypothetical protein